MSVHGWKKNFCPFDSLYFCRTQININRSIKNEMCDFFCARVCVTRFDRSQLSTPFLYLVSFLIHCSLSRSFQSFCFLQKRMARFLFILFFAPFQQSQSVKWKGTRKSHPLLAIRVIKRKSINKYHDSHLSLEHHQLHLIIYINQKLKIHPLG